MPRLAYIIISLLMCHPVLAQLPDLTFRNIDLWPDASQGDKVRDIIEDTSGFLWIGTTMGVFRYDGNEFKSYTPLPDSNSISDNNISKVYMSPDGTIWIGTIAGGLNRYNAREDKLDVVLASDETRALLYELFKYQNNIWLGTSKGLWRYNLENGSKTLYQPRPEPLDSRGFSFRSIVVDSTDNHKLWVAGLEGPYLFDTRNGKFDYYEMPFGLKPASTYMIMDLYLSDRNTLWAGSWGGGMLRYNINLNKWDRFVADAKEDNRWTGVIFNFKVGMDNRFWVAGSDGFGQFDTETGEYQFYDYRKPGTGTIDSSFHYNCIAQTAQGHMIVSRINGLSISSPLYITNSPLSHPPVISDVRVDGKPVIADSSNQYLTTFLLSGDQKDITFTLAAPGIYGPALTYSFELEGYDKDWQTLKEGRAARYTNLSQGNYTFRYRISSDNNTWLEGKPVKVHKTVFAWRRPWFIATCLLAAVVIVVVIYRLHFRAVQREMSLKQEFDRKEAELELKALRSQMNPHFMFNSLNSIKHFILTNEPLKASEYLTNFATLIRSTLHNSGEKLIPLSKEIETLLLYVELEQLRFKSKFNFNCYISPEVDTENIWIPPMILQPYIENAIWHGLMHLKKPGTLSLHIQKQNGYVKCTIEDDGIGRKLSSELKSKSATGYKSMGMGITKNRIDIHNKISELGIDLTIRDIVDGQGNAMGTTVSINIPAATGESKNIIS